MMRRVLVPAAIVVIVVISFLPALDGQFLNWDDSTLFTKNHDFRGLGAAQLRWMFTTTLAGHYMPLTWLTLGLNYRLGGMSPWGYHLAAILLHAANAVLFYLVARRLLRVALGSPPGGHDSADDEPPGLAAGAAVAALVFALHPQRVDSVAWVTERGTLVSTALYLMAAGAGPRRRTHAGDRCDRRLGDHQRHAHAAADAADVARAPAIRALWFNAVGDAVRSRR